MNESKKSKLVKVLFAIPTMAILLGFVYFSYKTYKKYSGKSANEEERHETVDKPAHPGDTMSIQ